MTVATVLQRANPLPPASGTTIFGIGILVAVGVGVALHHYHFPLEEAALMDAVTTACYLMLHPEVNRAIPVSPNPPNLPITTTES